MLKCPTKASLAWLLCAFDNYRSSRLKPRRKINRVSKEQSDKRWVISFVDIFRWQVATLFRHKRLCRCMRNDWQYRTSPWTWISGDLSNMPPLPRLCIRKRSFGICDWFWLPFWNKHKPTVCPECPTTNKGQEVPLICALFPDWKTFMILLTGNGEISSWVYSFCLHTIGARRGFCRSELLSISLNLSCVLKLTRTKQKGQKRARERERER